MNSTSLPDYLQLLHQHIGCRIIHNGQSCQLIEILHHGPMLVFRCDDKQQPGIQANQHGNASRRVAQTYTISLFNEAGTDLHPVAKECLPESIHQSLLQGASE